ncbi:MAG TPA: hypothetical protein VF837_02010 [Patescibacteria group bacterium]
MIRKRFILPVVLTTVLGGAVIGTNKIQAYNANPFADLAQMISQKFGVDQTKVQAVLDQYKAEEQQKRQAEMETKMETRLSQLVTEGKITAGQKQAIIDEHNLIQTKYGLLNMQGKTPAERKTLMEQRKADIEAWAKAQGIVVQYLGFGFGFDGGRGGFRR